MSIDRRRSSGTEWETEVGYTRAVRAGPMVKVSGTTATNDEGEIVGEGDPYRQAVQAFRNVVAALEEVGAAVGDVTRTRMYVTDATQWREVGRAHRELFGDVGPATTLVEVSGLVEEEMLVEVEAEAWIDANHEGGGR